MEIAKVGVRFERATVQRCCGGGTPHVPQPYCRVRQPHLQLDLVAVRAVLLHLRARDEELLPAVA